jgi:signal transduction histidine kinase
LQNPLGIIVGFASALEEDSVSMSRKRLGEYLGTIVRNGHKMRNIIDALLLLAGVRNMDVQMGPVDMASVVIEARQRLALVIEEYQAEIILPDNWPAAIGYAPWLEEVWANLISNSIKYGGRPPRVVMGGEQQADGTVRLWIRDNGLGLAPEEQQRLFRPFSRLHHAAAKGHGLGLSIVRRIVEKLGGQVGIESEVGQGSVFFFTLPGKV